MKKILRRALVVLVSLSLLAGTVPAFVSAAAEDTVIYGLSTEYRENPIGIDVAKPVFGWKMRSSIPGQKQTAYQIRVAASEAKWDEGTYVWDSGKVASDKSVAISYAGESLAPGTRYFWRVSVWDKDGAELQSETAYFETGLATAYDAGGHPTAFDWSDAAWIGVGTEPQETSGMAEETKFTIDLDFRIVNGAFGFLFGGLDEQNFYMWQVNAGDSTLNDAPTGPLLRPHQWKEGKAATIGDQPDISKVLTGGAGEFGSLNVDAHMTISADNGAVTTTISTEKGSMTDTRSLEGLKLGKIGFRCWSDEKCYVDNIVIKDGDGKVLFDEDFENINRQSFDFGTKAACATVTDGRLCLDSNGQNLVAFNRNKPLISYTNFTVDMDFTIENAAMGIVFGATDEQNFYMWQVHAGGGPTNDAPDGPECVRIGGKREKRLF